MCPPCEEKVTEHGGYETESLDLRGPSVELKTRDVAVLESGSTDTQTWRV